MVEDADELAALVEIWRGRPCSYCKAAPSIHLDHIVPKALRRRHKGFDDLTVPSCGPCNWRKGTRRLVPMDYEPFDELPGVRPWKRWDGSVEGLREVLR